MWKGSYQSLILVSLKTFCSIIKSSCTCYYAAIILNVQSRIKSTTKFLGSYSVGEILFLARGLLKCFIVHQNSLSDMFWDCHSGKGDWRRMWKSTIWPAADTSAMPRHNCDKYRIMFRQIQKFVFDKYWTFAFHKYIFLLLSNTKLQKMRGEWCTADT